MPPASAPAAPGLKSFRAQHPEYDDLSDQDLALALHGKFYADVPIADYMGKIGVAAQPTAPSASIPERQTYVKAPPKAENFFQGVANFFTGEGKAEPGVGEISYQSVPEAKDQKFQSYVPVIGDVAAAAANALPRPVRNFIGAQQKATGVGLGFFLNANEEARANIIKKQVPSAEFRRDEYGNLQVRYDAEHPWGYVNRPGASLEDAQTFGNEAMKFMTAARFAPGASVGGLAAQTARAAAIGAGSTAAGQAASIPLGGDVNAGDVAANAAGAAAGNVVGAGISGALKAAPKIAQAIGDRFPGGAERAAERAAAASSLAGAMRAAGQSADAAAGQRAADLTAPADPSELAAIGEALGVRVARSQAAGDNEGKRWLLEAMEGLHGPAAQRQAQGLFADQTRGLSEAIKNTAGDAAVTTPQSGVGVMRDVLAEQAGAAREGEMAAWRQFQAQASKLPAYDAAAAGRTGLKAVVSGMDSALRDRNLFLDALPDDQPLYTGTSQVWKLASRMANASAKDVPITDIQRVVKLRQAIDAAWEQAKNDQDRAALTSMRGVVTDWLRTGAPNTLKGADAAQASALLRQADTLSTENARLFRDNRIIREMLAQDPQNPTARLTDQEVVERLFGGGNAGVRMGKDSVDALKAIKSALGPASPGWEATRRAVLLRLTSGLDEAIERGQISSTLPTMKRLGAALTQNKEAMATLFTPDELTRLTQAYKLSAALAPPAPNPINPSGSGITAARAMRKIWDLLGPMTKNIPGVGIAARGVEDQYAAGRVGAELKGYRPTVIADAVNDAWMNARSPTGAAIGAGYGALAKEDGTYPPR